MLLSVLIATFREFKTWMDSAAIHPANKTSFWKRLFGTSPTRSSFDKRKSAALSIRLEAQIKELNGELHRADGADLRVATQSATSSGKNLGVNVSAPVPGTEVGVGLNASKSSNAQASQESEEQYKRSKRDFLHRHILDYQDLFSSLAEISGGDAYLFLDDLYHIRRADQAHVLDYFHRIAKDHGLWLKVGTIRHRTRWYLQGDPPVGMKLGDDADEIDLDLTLEKYSLAKEFLLKVLTNFAETSGVTQVSSFITAGAIDRLVLASGGVARDFLSIFRRSVTVARERGGGHRGEKVGAEDVNVAAGEYDSSKREEFKRDTLDDNVPLEEEFQTLRTFCLNQNNVNCFLLDKELKGQEVEYPFTARGGVRGVVVV